MIASIARIIPSAYRVIERTGANTVNPSSILARIEYESIFFTENASCNTKKTCPDKCSRTNFMRGRNNKGGIKFK